jgi:hypothetical protein
VFTRAKIFIVYQFAAIKSPPKRACYFGLQGITAPEVMLLEQIPHR